MRVARASWLDTMPFRASTGWMRAASEMIGAGLAAPARQRCVAAKTAEREHRAGDQEAAPRPYRGACSASRFRRGGSYIVRAFDTSAIGGEHVVCHVLGRFRIPAVIVALGVMLSGCGVNNIPTLDEQAKAKWADVQNQYQRRADLIPNLVETVKGYAKQRSARRWRRSSMRAPRRPRSR